LSRVLLYYPQYKFFYSQMVPPTTPTPPNPSSTRNKGVWGYRRNSPNQTDSKSPTRNRFGSARSRSVPFDSLKFRENSANVLQTIRNPMNSFVPDRTVFAPPLPVCRASVRTMSSIIVHCNVRPRTSRPARGGWYRLMPPRVFVRLVSHPVGIFGAFSSHPADSLPRASGESHRSTGRISSDALTTR